VRRLWIVAVEEKRGKAYASRWAWVTADSSSEALWTMTERWPQWKGGEWVVCPAHGPVQE
jgi:hypothetical protein